jgi:galactokinase
MADIRDVLTQAFGPGGPAVAVRAPGRVNLIGEHTDYNDGFVFPMAIGFGIDLAARLRDAPEVRLHAADMGESVTVPLDRPLAPDRGHGWSNYPVGVLWALREQGVLLRGMDLAFRGDIPQGAGLSSSAALEVATAVALRGLLGFALDGPPLAKLCQHAENDFVGMQCGIMDQFISLMGKADHALLIDCRSLSHELVPLALGDHVVAICHSGVKHALVDSEYNKRRAECTAGVAAIRRRFPAVAALRDVTPEQLDACAPDLDPVVLRRCRHVVGECARTLESAAALRAGDLARFGRLMNASHDSLRDDYAVSCAEVDLLVAMAREVPGVLGARITGGGFGGCTVNLCRASAVETFRRDVLGRYQAQTGIAARLFVSSAADGAHVV